MVITLPPGLVGWWKFDEGTGTTAYDSSGNGHDGTWYGTGGHYVTGKTGPYAADFNGTDDNIKTTWNADMGTSSFTIVFWFYETFYAASGSSHHAIITNRGISPTQQDGFLIWDYYYPPGDIEARVGDGTNGFYYVTDNIYGVIYQKWIHKVMVVDRSNNTVQFYTNGVASGGPAATNITSSVDGSNVLAMGTSCCWGNYLKGYLDDVRIYNRALSIGEVQAIYNATK